MKLLEPYFLYAFLALAIPVIIHLFSFQKHKIIQFSNVAFLKQMVRSPLDRRQSGLTLSNGKAIWNCEYWIRAWFSLKNNEPKFKRQKFFEKFIKYGNDLYRYSNTKQGNIDWMIKVFNYKTNALEKINTDKYGD